MPMIKLRPATPDDAASIRSLICSVRINPLGLDWRRFIVATDPEGELVGCGQVKPHSDGSRELASIAVKEEWREQGIASAIIERLISEHPGTLYLTCRASLGSFYRRFGFRTISQSEMPPYFRRIHKLTNILQALHLMGEELLVMKREPAASV